MVLRGRTVLAGRTRRGAVVDPRRLRRRRRTRLRLGHRLLLLLRLRKTRTGETARLPVSLRLRVDMLRLGRLLRATAAAEEVLHALKEAGGLLLRVVMMPLSMHHGGPEGGHSH